MQRKLLATVALLGALVGSVLLGGAGAAAHAQADGDGPGISINTGINRGW